MTEIRVPTLGESVTEATIGKWFKQPGDPVEADEPLVELETEKVTIEVPAPAAGVLSEIVAKDGETVAIGALLGQIDQGAGARAAAGKSAEPEKAAPPPKAVSTPAPKVPKAAAAAIPLAPSVRRLSSESGIAAEAVPGTGPGGRVTKGDMLAAIERAAAAPTAIAQPAAAVQVRAPSPADDAAREERVRMTKLRQTIAKRLKDRQKPRRDAAALQGGGNERGEGGAQPLRGFFREEAGGEARLHGFFRGGLRSGAKGISRRQRRDRWRRHHLGVDGGNF